MGMFTSIKHPDGYEIQIKTGQDECAWYNVGDTLPWRPDPYYPGCHVDDVYNGCGYPSHPNCWVIVKNCVIVAIEPITFRSGADDDIPDEYERLIAKYGITTPDPNLWTEQQWSDKKRREAESWARFEALRQKYGYVACMAHLLTTPSFAHQILTPTKLIGHKGPDSTGVTQ